MRLQQVLAGFTLLLFATLMACAGPAGTPTSTLDSGAAANDVDPADAGAAPDPFGGAAVPFTNGPSCDLAHYRCSGGRVCVIDLSNPCGTSNVYAFSSGTCHDVATDTRNACSSNDDCAFTEQCGWDGTCHSPPCMTPGGACPNGCVAYLEPHWCGPLPCICSVCPAADAGWQWAPVLNPIDNP